jgi:hypothetical protein
MLDSRFSAAFIILVFFASMISPVSAIRAETAATAWPSGDRVLFVEHYMLANGTVIEGKAPFRSVNFPTYWYNENTKQLNGKIDFPINDSLSLIFGDVLTLKGNFGAGTGNKLFGVYSLPVHADQAYIYGMDVSGNIAMHVNQKTLILKPGESYTFSQNETSKDNGAVIEIKYDHTYVNHGFINKRNIGSGLVST